jgi:ubiquitin carboxyl-terminal hydrolase 9/13
VTQSRSLLRLFSSGPHHGHYVSIVKAGGVWKLFDDDNVETIKESDIPRYFGDSNCGSAYVLYYQAVNINLPSLGLRPPTPPPVTNHVPVPVSVSAASDYGQAPTLPPGLTADHDSSDPAESSGPTTPAPSNPTYSPKINNSPVHSKPNLPHDFPPPPPIPQQPPQKSQGGLFHSLRHVPSIKIKNPTGDKKPLSEAVSMVSTNSSASGSLPSPGNVSLPQLHNKPEVTPNTPASTLVEPTSPRSNGIGKDKWYKRKSIKSKDKERTPTSLKPLELDGAPRKLSDSLAPPSPASTMDFVSQGSSSPSHPQSDVEGEADGYVLPRSFTRKSPAPAHRIPTTSSASMPSLGDNTPAVPPLPRPSVSPTRTSRPLPQTRPSLPLDSPRGRTTVKTGELNGHAKLNGDADRRSVPSRPSSLHADMLAANMFATSSSSSSELLTPTPGDPLSAESPSSGMTAMVSSSLPTGTTPTTAAGQGNGGGTGSNWKRATRKLSLTGTMLGFTKKEKHKDKLGAIPP